MKLSSLLVGLLALSLLAGCSAISGFGNKVSETSDKVLGSRADDSELYKDPYPSLTDVPDEVPNTPSGGQRQVIANNLEAEQQRAAYSQQQLNATGNTEVPRRNPAAAPTYPTASPGPISNSAIQSRQAQTDALLAQQRARVSNAQSQSPYASLPTPASTPVAPGYGTQVASANPYAQPTASQSIGSQPVATALPRPVTQQQLPVPPKPAGKELAIIYFSHGSTNLSKNDQEILKDVAAILRRDGGILHMVGYASSTSKHQDPQAARQANGMISAKRLETVGTALLRSGVARNQITAEPRADIGVQGQSEAAARRVEIYLR